MAPEARGTGVVPNPLISAFTVVRSIVGTCFGVAWTFLFCVICIVTAFAGWRDLTTELMRIWGRAVCAIFGIKILVRGEENLRAAGGAIAVFNHQSHFDIPVMMGSTHKHIRFGAKVELFKIPFFGPAMRAVGTLPIARENRAEVMRIYKEAEAKFKEGFIFVLAPEGTRQKQPGLGRFKKGPFIFAIEGGVPIVPIVISGAYAVLPKNHLTVNRGRWTRTIEVEYLPPISTTNYPLKEIDRLVSETRAAMLATYEAKAARFT